MDIKKITSKYNFLFFAPLLIYLGKRSPIAFDEGFYILQSKWILENGDWFSPMYWGNLSLDRTIGIQYLLALSQKVFGDNFLSIYVPNILFGILMLYLTSELHKELLGKKYKIISSILLSTTFLWINYYHMATQDIIYGTFITLGTFSIIKAFKSNKVFYFFLSGLWIGLSVMFKTYLTVIPFIGVLPFLISKKFFYNRFFWIGTFVGFLPFFIWTYKIISSYGLETFNGIYDKFNALSKKKIILQILFIIIHGIYF